MAPDEAITEYHNKVLESAAKAIEAGTVDVKDTSAAEDIAYNTALEHAAAAIRALKV